ncbi:GNAT family acetyltransferase [Kineosporia sp. J2-2]|uniref:GNAT family acetyltransferase n=1 Tax=Kineosporia corallincola TaxID=2835133 RepID=A0ABS5TJM5_9ACTN|nr:GNAT family acetyltransferase [Kineosporia corallincola]MBT0771220.1 GNAT family acetyltransferase [Kineosporia corallincola]
MKIDVLPENLHDAAVKLWHETGLTRPWNDPAADLRRAVEGDDSAVLGAVDDGTLVATAMVGHDGHRGWVYYLAVAPDRQGAGVGRLMMAACEDWVAGRRIPKIQLMVRADNTAAAGFYERLGYTDAEVVVLGKRLG